MTQAITRCPACGMSFRVSESQLRVADGAVRCGACLHVFQAEEYFVSPMLDVTEQLAIQREYWADFDAYVQQVAGPAAGAEPVARLMQAPSPVTTPLAPPVQEPEYPGDPEMPDLDPTGDPGLDAYDAIPVLNEELSPEEVEEAFAAYADAGLMPLDTLPPESVGQGDLFDSSSTPEPESFHVSEPEPVTEPRAEQTPATGEEGLMSFYLDYLDHHPGQQVAAPAADGGNTGLTITATRDPSPDDSDDRLSFEIGADPDELIAPRGGGVTNAMIGWFAASLVMVIVGAAQYVFFNMDHYAQVESYRPFYVTACRYLRCDVPAYDNIELLRTRELIVRTHPTEPNALTVDVLLSNNGDFRQEFPGLELTFFNIDGEKTASRVFTVAEYLGGELRGLRFIPARTEVRLSLELVDPGNQALGYEMQVVPL